MKEPLVSVVITTWNRRDELKRTLVDLQTQDYHNTEIIVVDNGSQDGTLEMLREEFKKVRVIALERNIGIEGTNIGMREAEGDFILLLDNDSSPKEDAIKRMVDVFLRESQIGIIAFEIHGPGYRPHSPILSSPVYVYGFSGGGVGIRRSILNEVGGFPEEYFLYLCEQDLSIRVLNAGYKIVQIPGIIAYHRTSPVSRNVKEVAYYYTRNFIYLYFKYYPLGEIFLRMAQLLFMVFYASFEQRTPVYIRAFFDGLGSLKKIKRQKNIKKDVLRMVRIPLGLLFTFYR
jgi:hypothetical protein